MVNYPHKKKPTVTSEKSISFGKRGMSFEDDLTKSNEHYLAANKAVLNISLNTIIVKYYYLILTLCKVL